MSRHPLWAHLLLIDPDRVQRRLDDIRAAGVVPRVPNSWQIALGVLRMVHRIALRGDTVGTCASSPVRSTWRAKLLAHRALRFPFLLSERAIAPLDLSGLLSSSSRVIHHLLGAHHDGNQFSYDLQMLAIEPGKLDDLCRRVRDIVESDGPRAAWL